MTRAELEVAYIKKYKQLQLTKESRVGYIKSYLYHYKQF